MNKIFSFTQIGLEKITAPHPQITDPQKRLEAKTVSFMSLVMVFGAALNLIFGSGLTILTLIVFICGYGFSRTRRYSVATYLILISVLYSVIRSLLQTGIFSNHAIFSNLAWLTLSLVFASLLLSVRETILVAIVYLVIIYLLTIFVPEINFNVLVVSFGYIGVFSALLIVTMWQRNVIEQARQEKIHFQASHDDLTGLPNRALFHDRLTQALARMERNGVNGCVLYLDLDDFKHVNDEFSHEAGDHVLKVIADRIQKCKRKTDTGARFSGDEFVILLENVNGPRNAASIAKKLLDTISTPIQVQNSEVIVSASIGIAMIPQDGLDGSDILINADTAMYAAKSDGKNAISFFNSEMKEEMLHKIYLSKGMHRGLAKNEFYLDYQPQYNAKTGEIFGAEALMRWQHPKLGIISPGEFIPIAEKNGMIIPMGQWVIEDVFLFHQSLASVLHKNIRLSANISGRQLRDDKFIDYLTTFVRNSGVNPGQLELEITETSVFENIEYTLSILKKLKSLGIRLAIDEFGTGYSSLSYLEKLPFDTVKIDIAFIRKITNIQVKLPILKGIISIANGMGLDVIAEGVENETQLDYLISHGCHLVQGYYFNPSFSEQELLRKVLKQDVIKPRQPIALNVAYSD